MGGSVPLPALDLRPMQPVDALGSFQKLMALRSLANQQQLQQAQLQSQQQEQQIRQQSINDQQLIQGYLRNNSSATYGDAANALRDKLSTKGYSDAMDLDSRITQAHAAATDAQLKVTNAVHDQQQKIYSNIRNLSDADLAQQTPQIASQWNAIPGNHIPLDPNQPITQQQLQQLGIRRGLEEAYLKQEQDKRETAAKTAESQGKAEEATATAEEKRQQSAFYKQAGFGAPGVPADTAAMVQWLRDHPGKTPLDFYGAKAQETAAAEQPYKIQTALAEAKAKQMMEGLAKPGYAFNPATGKTELTDQTAYLQSGGKLQAFRPVGEKDVRDDTMLTNRLGDVHQKLTEYEDALQKPIDSKDQGNIAAILGTTKFQLGGIHFGPVSVGVQIPMERVDAALNKENLKGLSDNARDQLVAYRNMREALLGYKTVLSGSSRGSDKQMELLEQAIPDPSITDPDYSKRALTSFRGNLRVVGQGLPTLPGIKSPEEIEQEAKQPSAPTQQKPAGKSKAEKYGVPIQ